MAFYFRCADLGDNKAGLGPPHFVTGLQTNPVNNIEIGIGIGNAIDDVTIFSTLAEKITKTAE